MISGVVPSPARAAPLPDAAGLLPPLSPAFAGARILIVDDDDVTHIVLRHILSANEFIVASARSADEAWLLMQEHLPDLVICDVMMPGTNGIEFCRKVKATPATALLPVLLASGLNDPNDRVSGFEAGADEYVVKPFRGREIVARVRSMLRMKFLQDQLENAEQVIFSLARAVEAKDRYTGEHIERVSSFAVAIGRSLGLGAEACAHLLRGGILHDIGKIAVPDSILNKPGRLSGDEYEQIKRHPEVGEGICRSLKTLRPVLDMIRHHHERLDGSGYPDGLCGEMVTMPSRIMAVCDVFDALTTARAYRDAMPLNAALDLLEEGVQNGHWDRDVVALLQEVVRAEGAAA